MMTRKALANAIDDLDDQIKVLQTSKAEAYTAYREQLESKGTSKPDVKVELVAMKAAIRRRREIAADENAVIEKDELTDSILNEIRSGTPNATRAHHAQDSHAA